MADEESAVPYGRKTQHIPAIDEVHIFWITAGLGCDGDTVSITAASDPSIEDVLLGAIPGLPKVHLHNPVLAYEVGDDFMKSFHQAARGEIDNFVLVVEGSIPNENLSGDGYWAALGTDPKTGRADQDHRLDRPSGAKSAGGGGCRHLRHLRRHSRDEGQSDRLHGTAGFSRRELEIESRAADCKCSRLPGAARQFHGDLALSAAPARRPRADDPDRRSRPADNGCSA